MNSAPERTPWASAAERGSLLGLRFLVWSYRGIGRRLTGFFLYPTVAYFVLAAGPARRASLRYLRQLHALGHPKFADRKPGLREVFHHFHTFAELTLDRFCFWANRYDDFEVTTHGLDEFDDALGLGRGMVMLGAHLGSFDVLRVLARDKGVRVNAVMYVDNAEQINTIFKELDPNSDVRVIQMDPNSVRSAFEIKRCLDAGEIVAMLGDRGAPGGRGRTGKLRFLERTVALPEGPFLLPMLFGCPVVLCIALRRDTRKYEAYFESLTTPDGPIPAASRRDAMRALMQSFVKRLEHHCLSEPYQWFNFFDYWSDDDAKDT